MMIPIRVVLAICLFALECTAQTSLSRWGQAVAYIPSPPAIILHGGKSDTSNAFSYTSAPNSPETNYISLTSSFAVSSPPLITLDSSNSPAYAWHTLTPFSNVDGKWDFLSFGGDAGPSEPTQTQSDSAWYMTLDPDQRTANWIQQPNGWGNQPSRRIYHSAVGGGGKVFITGGLRNDGSGIGFAETYTFDPASGFTQTAPLPRAVYHHGSVLLPNGTLIVLGGISISMASGVPAVQPLSSISILDTTSTGGVWTEHPISGISPSPRRGMATVLSSDGKEIFVNGGASVTFDEIYSDTWVLNVETLQWRQVGQSGIAGRMVVGRQMSGDPGARYDHSAVLGPDGQVVILGGYGGDGVADPGPFVFDLPEGTWSTEYTPEPGATAAASTPVNSDNPSATPSAEAASASVTSQSGSATPTSTDSQSTTNSLPTTSSESSSATPSPSTSQVSATAPPLPLAAQLGIIIGIVCVAALILGILIWRYRRRRRHQKLLKAIYGSNAPNGPSRPYGDREKGGEGLMEEAREEEYNEYKNVPPTSPEKTVGLGMGIIKASFASLRNFRRDQPSETYAVLNDEGPSSYADAASPVRQPTRRSGQGIRLLGPRSQRASYAPVASPQSIATGDSRMDMLSDEDSRNFPKPKDWNVGEDDVGGWKSARSILADHTEDPFEDDESSRPPITGGPVPTPFGSRTSFHPSHERDIGDGDFGLPHLNSEPVDLAGLLPPTSHKRYSAMSGISGPSSVSDLSEGVVHYAHIGSPASTSLSPESTYMPIKRTDTFFKRMAAGGITSLLSNKSINRSTSTRSTAYNIRDPAPPPSLWPVVSRDMMRVQSGLHNPDDATPPTAWKGEDLQPVRPTHHHGPSLTSITSARSMRDMVIVQREPTDSSAESVTIETTSPEPDRHAHSYDRDHRDVFDDRHEARARDNGQGGETPESIVFDGADFAMSPETNVGGDLSRRTTIAPVPIIVAPTTPTSARIRSTNTGSPRAIPPDGSPIPHPVLMHRRPVSEMVNSINKRGSGSGDTTPISLFSPQSRYSSPASTPRQVIGIGRRPTTLYEAVKRDKLLVANPDGGK